MKKAISIILLLCFSVCIVVIFSGCTLIFGNGSRAHLTRTMRKIRPEVKGYELVKDYYESDIDFEGIVEVQGVTIEIKRNGYYAYTIEYQGQTLNIDDAFMKENSQAYVKIHDMWFDFYDMKEKHNVSSRIDSVCTYDNQLFIITNGLTSIFTTKFVEWQHPITLYVYDIFTGKVSYVDYYEELRTAHYPLRIQKVG